MVSFRVIIFSITSSDARDVDYDIIVSLPSLEATRIIRRYFADGASSSRYGIFLPAAVSLFSLAAVSARFCSLV